MGYKIKTKKAAKKRFKLTGSGKLVYNKAGRRHLLEHQKPGRKRNKQGDFEISKSDERKVTRMLPNL